MRTVFHGDYLCAEGDEECTCTDAEAFALQLTAECLHCGFTPCDGSCGYPDLRNGLVK
jgi:hypothetical protein